MTPGKSGSKKIGKPKLKLDGRKARFVGPEGQPVICLADQIPLDMSMISPRYFAYPRTTLASTLAKGAVGSYVKEVLPPRLRALFTLRQRAGKSALQLEARIAAESKKERSDLLALQITMARNYVLTLAYVFNLSVLQNLLKTTGLPVQVPIDLERLNVIVFTDWTYFIEQIDDNIPSEDEEDGDDDGDLHAYD